MKRPNYELKFFGYTIPEVARATGLPTTTVWRHAMRARKISDVSAIKYHRCLDIPLCELRPDLWPPEPAQNLAHEQEQATA